MYKVEEQKKRRSKRDVFFTSMETGSGSSEIELTIDDAFLESKISKDINKMENDLKLDQNRLKDELREAAFEHMFWIFCTSSLIFLVTIVVTLKIFVKNSNRRQNNNNNVDTLEMSLL